MITLAKRIDNTLHILHTWLTDALIVIVRRYNDVISRTIRQHVCCILCMAIHQCCSY